LKDAELAAQLGLSATPVREARLKRVAPIDFQAGEDGGWMEDRRRKYTGIRLT
jgi:hypothetical protein